VVVSSSGGRGFEPISNHTTGVKMVLHVVVPSLSAQYLENKTRTGWPGVRIVLLGDVLSSCVSGTVHRF